MPGNLQIQIPTPCNEQWDKMRPEEKGRFCAACSKVVVDFSLMSDQEVLTYMARASQSVCGRFDSHQLGRDMSARRTKAGWWKWAVAGLLFTGRVSAQTRPPRAEVVKVPAAPAIDSFKMLAPVEVRATVMGKLHSTQCTSVVSGGAFMVTRVSRIQKIVRDTLQVFMPKKELVAYPNPVQRGAAIHLSWKAEEGEYQVGLFNSAGVQILQKQVQLASPSQVDIMEIPASLPGGMYFLRAVKNENGKVYTQKVVVI
ncbi:MAG: T9SS type A sorting domain-containing protein [Bacteroidetes bacterium]|nr:T9SS type A sorting domain-containing protein [Bacteroidota bacterium]